MSDLPDAAVLPGGSEQSPPQKPAPDWLGGLPADENPYALRLKREPELGEVTAGTRAQLNQAESYYKGTLRGSQDLIELSRVAQMSPDVWAEYNRSRQALGEDEARGRPLGAAPGELSAPVVLTPEEARQQLDHIRADLAQYETMPWFEGAGGLAAAIGGQFAGGLQSPESFITRLPGMRQVIGRVFGEAAETVAARIAEAGLTQGTVNLATDPAAQAGAIVAGVQPEGYDPTRTALAFPVGAVVGGVLQGADEAGGALARRRAARAVTPESLVATPTPETPTARPSEPTEIRTGAAPEAAGAPEAVPATAAAPPTETAPTGAAAAPARAPELAKTWDTLSPADFADGRTLRLYRGEATGSAAQAKGSAVTGGWFTTDSHKAALYGDISYIDVTREELGLFARGHGGPDEFVTDDPSFRERAQPIDRKPPQQTEGLRQPQPGGQPQGETAPREKLTANWDPAEQAGFLATGTPEQRRLTYMHKHVSVGNVTQAPAFGPGLAKIVGEKDGLTFVSGLGDIYVTDKPVARNESGYLNIPHVIAALKTARTRDGRVIDHIVVSPEFQRRGIATEMLRQAEQAYPDLRTDRTTGLVSEEGAATLNAYNASRGPLIESGRPRNEPARLPELPVPVEPVRLIGQSVNSLPVHRVAVPGAAPVEVQPVVVEARDLKTSADPGYDPALQPRDRDRAAAEAQVREIAGRLEPERLGFSAEADRGAPIVGSDGMVESGNGRVMAIRQAYEDDGPAAARYRDWLAAQGVDVSGYEHPVLVRQRLTEMTPEARQGFAIAANRPATLALSAPERALADARVVTGDMLALIKNPDDLAAAANREFVRAFAARLPQSEQGMLSDASGGLSSEGLTRIRNAVLARAYGGAEGAEAASAALLARIAESIHDDVKSISNALVAAASEWARLRAEITEGRVRPDLDLTGELVEAVRRTADLRAKRVPLADALAQQDAFDQLDPKVEAWMRMFYDASGRRAVGQARITAGLKAYADEARKIAAGPGLDLGLPDVSAGDVQRVAARAASGEGEQPILFSARRAGDGTGAEEGGAGIRGPGAGDAGSGAGGPRPEGDRAGLGQPAAGAEREPGGAVDAGISEARLPPTNIPPAGAGTDPALSLQRQGDVLADMLDLPLRQGRVRNRQASGQYDTKQDVARVRNIADFETVAHEAGHAVEKKVGAELTALTNRFAAELAPLDYDPTQGRVNEGFAEWTRLYLTAPAMAERSAPGFSTAFRDLMQRQAPDMLEALNDAQASYRVFTEARSDVRLDAIVHRSEPEGVMDGVRSEGLPKTISLWVGKAYQAIFDDKAPATRAVRELSRLWRDAIAAPVKLEGSDNPELLLRMFARSQQASVRDMLDGIRPYHSVQPEGPALREALIKATGQPGLLGRFDETRLSAFANYLVARRADVLWAKYDAGLLPNRPVAMSKADVADAIARLETENPSFREASDLVHDYTRQLLRKMYEGGLVDRALYDNLRAETFYVPLYRDLSDRPLSGEVPTAGAGRAEGPGMAELIRRQTGSDRDIIDPVQSIMTQTFLVNRTLAHNDIVKSLVNLARNATKSGATGVGRILEEIPPREIVGKRFELNEAIAAAAKQNGVNETDAKVLLGAVADIFGDDPIMGTIFRHEPAKARGEPIVFWKEGGELRAVRMISETEGSADGMALYEAVANLPTPVADWAVKLMAGSATMLRAGIVTNPIFAVTNWTRDQMAAAILRPGYIPFNPRGLIREIGQDRYAQLYTYGGGVSPGAGRADLSEFVDRSVDALARKGWATQKIGGLADLVTRGDIIAGAKALGETVETAETGTRLNVFQKVYDQKRRQGLNDYDAMIEAAYQASDLLDFGRHGSGTEMIRRLVPFLNAHMQAIDKARRTLFEPLYRAATGDIVTEADQAALRNAGAAWGLIGVSGALGMAYALWASRHDAYHDANSDLRATHLVIPGDAFGYPGKILLVPKPFELAIGFNLGEMLGLGMATGDPRAADFAMGGAYEVLAPPNVLNSIPLVKTYAELTLNRSFFTGRDIVPDRLQRLATSEQYTERTSQMARTIGQSIGVSPIKVEYAIGNAFGLWGRDLLALSNTADPNAPAPAVEDMMGLRRVIKDANRASQTAQTFWQQAGTQTGKFVQANNTYMQMLGQFRDRDAADFLGKLPATERAYVTLNSAADDAGRPRFTADEKRLNPLRRGADAVLQIQGYIGELNRNAQRTIGSGEQTEMDPDTRRHAIDALRELARYEQQNALTIAGERGYAGRKLLSTEDQFAVIRAIAAPVADEIATRYATARIVPTEAVAKAWPEAQRRLLAEGSESDLRDLAFDAKADGYAFEGDRVRRAPRRRVAIPALPGVQATAP